MARPQKSRRLCTPPLMKGFKPYGMPLCKTETITLNFEEYESIRLVNYDLYSQEKAAEEMQVSRPTLTRIYNKAIKKIACAFIEGKAIDITGGNYRYEKEWYRCNTCNKLIEGFGNHVKCGGCKKFGPDELVKLNQ